MAATVTALPVQAINECANQLCASSTCRWASCPGKVYAGCGMENAVRDIGCVQMEQLQSLFFDGLIQALAESHACFTIIPPSGSPLNLCSEPWDERRLMVGWDQGPTLLFGASMLRLRFQGWVLIAFGDIPFRNHSNGWPVLE